MSKKEKYEAPKPVAADKSLPVDSKAAESLTPMELQAESEGAHLSLAFRSVIGRQGSGTSADIATVNRGRQSVTDLVAKMFHGRKTKGRTEAKPQEPVFEVPKVRNRKKKKKGVKFVPLKGRIKKS
jgi:hypothetical protein